MCEIGEREERWREGEILLFTTPPAMSAVSKACHLFARGVQHMCSVCVVCEGRSSGGGSSSRFIRSVVAASYGGCCCRWWDG